MFTRILILFMPAKYQPDLVFLRQVPIGRVHLFTAIQMACFSCLWVVKSYKATSICFPLMVRIHLKSYFEISNMMKTVNSQVSLSPHIFFLTFLSPLPPMSSFSLFSPHIFFLTSLSVGGHDRCQETVGLRVHAERT